jgi:hypothetical protein
MRKEMANKYDVSDVYLEYRWRSSYHSADRGNHEVAEKVTRRLPKNLD